MNSKEDEEGPVSNTPRSNKKTSKHRSLDDEKHPHVQQRRRSSARPKLPPERYVACPSRRGLGAREGDYVFLSLYSPEAPARDGDAEDGAAATPVSRRGRVGRITVKEKRGEIIGEIGDEKHTGLDRAECTTVPGGAARDVTREEHLHLKKEESTPLSQSNTTEAITMDSNPSMPLKESIPHDDENEKAKDADHTNDNDDDDDNNPWTCKCGLIVDATRRRCKCRRWKGGKRKSVNGSKTKKLSKRSPLPRSSVSSTAVAAAPQAKAVATCKVFRCSREQCGDEGFCCLHYDAVVKSNDCGGEGRADTTWTCDCGQEMTGDTRRCGKCLSMRDGTASSRELQVNQAREEEKEKEVEKQKSVKLDSESGIQRESNHSALIVASAHKPQDVLMNRNDQGQIKLGDDDATKDLGQCQIEGCEKIKHVQCDGLCWKHFRERTAKFDNVEEANDIKIVSSPTKLASRRKSTGAIPSSNRKEASRRRGRASTPFRKSRGSIKNKRLHPNGSIIDVDATSNGLATLRRSGRTLTPSPKTHYVVDIDSDSESSEEEMPTKTSGRGRKRSRETGEVVDLIEKDKNLCKFEGCRRFRRRDGYCANHSPGVDQSSLRALTREVCKFEGCNEYSHTGYNGFCAAHFSTTKGEQQSCAPIQESEQRHLHKICQTLEENDADNIMDEDRIIENMTKAPHSESFITSSTRTKNPEGRFVCKVVSCKKESRKNGFCKLHNAVFTEKPAQFCEASPVMTSPAIKKLKISDSKVSIDVDQKGHEKDTISQFAEGVMVAVEPGGYPARVMKVHLNVTSGNWRYDIVNILGGREQGVDEKRLSAYSSDDIFQSLSLGSATFERHAPLLTNANEAAKRVMLELTRYQLLSGQDCWICTTCSVFVPSLTMSCGSCKRHPTFVPLEMGEFEEFVRCQRRKRNRLWLREADGKISSNNLSSSEFESSAAAPISLHLCKFQACVQWGQTSNDGYCESHFNLIHLVKEQDRPLIDEYMYHLFEQLKPCIMTDGDRIGFNRDRHLGEPGITCKYCEGQRGGSAKGGRSFPKDESSLRPPSFSRGFAKHLKACVKCPKETKERLVSLEAAKSDADDSKQSKITRGRKKFFHRVWNRLQRLKCPENGSRSIYDCEKSDTT